MRLRRHPANRAVSYVTWFDAARFANWMANGQPGGRQAAGTTENGSSNLARASGNRAVPRNSVNPNTGKAPTHFIPTENEWYKSAYFAPNKNGAGSPGSWIFATQRDSDSPQTNLPPGQAAANNVNDLVGPAVSATTSAARRTAAPDPAALAAAFTMLVDAAPPTRRPRR